MDQLRDLDLVHQKYSSKGSYKVSRPQVLNRASQQIFNHKFDII